MGNKDASEVSTVIKVDNTELKETIELIETFTAKVERANEAIKNLRDTLEVAPLSIDIKKLVKQN